MLREIGYQDADQDETGFLVVSKGLGKFGYICTYRLRLKFVQLTSEISLQRGSMTIPSPLPASIDGMDIGVVGLLVTGGGETEG